MQRQSTTEMCVPEMLRPHYSADSDHRSANWRYSELGAQSGRKNQPTCSDSLFVPSYHCNDKKVTQYEHSLILFSATILTVMLCLHDAIVTAIGRATIRSAAKVARVNVV